MALNFLTASEVATIRLIGGLYDNGESWLTDEEVEELAIYIGAVVNGVYLPSYDRLVAVECIRTLIARGDTTRTDALRQRIRELLIAQQEGTTIVSSPGRRCDPG